jgi:DNA-directed RNA polymerase subunit M/transcription elongation factor TFIIS
VEVSSEDQIYELAVKCITLDDRKIDAFDKVPAKDVNVKKRISIRVEEKTEIQPQKTVRCKNCGHEVTSPELAIEPNGHTFRNPLGFSFYVICYRDAPGTYDAGEPTTEHCWFPGYAWSFAICKKCHSHLGWWYCGQDRFAGLIATRLIR